MANLIVGGQGLIELALRFEHFRSTVLSNHVLGVGLANLIVGGQGLIELALRFQHFRSTVLGHNAATVSCRVRVDPQRFLQPAQVQQRFAMLIPRPPVLRVYLDRPFGQADLEPKQPALLRLNCEIAERLAGVTGAVVMLQLGID